MSSAGVPDPPLTGLRVVELATLYSAPQIGAMLGDLGADVVKVEAPGGDPMRQMGVIRDGVSRNWSWVARGKRSIVLDLDATDDRATFGELVSVADVLIENLTPRVRARWDCTFDALAAVNPRLVVVAVSCYGLTGPYADRPGAGTLAEAFGGLTDLTGEPDGPPMLASVPLGDTLTAFSGVIGALAACWGRDRRDGLGRLVDVSMYEPVLQILGGTIAGYDPDDPPARSGSRVRGGAPRNVYRTSDGRYVAGRGRPTRKSPGCSHSSTGTARPNANATDRPRLVSNGLTSSTRSSPSGSRRATETPSSPRSSTPASPSRPSTTWPRSSPTRTSAPGEASSRCWRRAAPTSTPVAPRSSETGSADPAGPGRQPSWLPTMPTKLTISPG